MDFTFSGMVTLSRPLHFSKVLPAMVSMFAGSVTSFNWVQPPNAKYARLLTLSGMVTLVRPVQLENALSSMVSTPSEMVREVRPVQ